ncbi:MAG: hypothetical protein ABIH92_00375 [Nanoarchaeota archaeon]
MRISAGTFAVAAPLTDLEIVKIEKVQRLTAPSESDGGGQGGYSESYFKTCSYTWDSTSYIGEDVRIIASITDEEGDNANDQIKVEVVEQATSGSGSSHYMSGEELEIQITQPGDGDEVSGNVQIHATAKGPNELGQMVLAFEAGEIGHAFPIPSENCEDGGSVPQPYEGNVKVSLKPEKQESELGQTVVYHLIVEDLHAATNAVEYSQYKYELEFEGKDYVHGFFDEETIFLTPGEKTTVKVRVSARIAGTHIFTVIAAGENAEARARGVLSVDGNEDTEKTLKLDIDPEKQYSESGLARYKVTVKDLHKPTTSLCPEGRICASNTVARDHEYKYELYFESKQEVSGKFETGETLYLQPGEEKTVTLVVEAEEDGSYVFVVTARNTEHKENRKGLLVMGDYEPPTPTLSFFEGEGFAINEDGSEGKLTQLHVLKNEDEIRGKIKFDKTTYALKGTVFNEDFYFSLYETNDGGFTVSVGEFHGEIKNFDDFFLLEGELTFETAPYYGNVWTLTAFAKAKKVFIETTETSDSPVVETISSEDVVAIRKIQTANADKEIAEEIYVLPKKIERKRILGIIPNPWGEKVLRVEVVEEDKVREKVIEAFGKEKIGSVEVEIGSLDNEEAIEMSVTQITP